MRFFIFLALLIATCVNAQVYSQLYKLYAPTGQDGAGFGYAIACTGSFIAVGAPNTSNGAGAVYIYYYFDSSFWRIKQMLNSTSTGSLFGSSLAINSNFLFVGAPNYTNSSGVNVGGVFIYKYNLATTNFEATTCCSPLVAPDGNPNALFGYSIAAAATLLIIGSPGQTENQGEAYTYISESDTDWDLITPLFSGGNISANDNFGTAVAVSNINFIVSKIPSQEAVGTVYVFQFVNNTYNALTQTISSPSFISGSPDGFGSFLSATQNYLLVGAHISETAFLFKFGSTTYNQVGKNIIASDNTQGHFFGSNGVALEKTNTLELVVCAAKSNSGTGEVYVFDAYNLPITEESNITSAYGVNFGQAVQFTGSTLVIGDPGADGNSGKSGAIMLYQNGSGVNSLGPQLITIFTALLFVLYLI